MEGFEKQVKIIEAEHNTKLKGYNTVKCAVEKAAPTREKELESAERNKASVVVKLEKVYSGLKGKAEELRPVKENKEATLRKEERMDLIKDAKQRLEAVTQSTT